MSPVGHDAFDQRAEDELRADHEAGHPNPTTTGCHLCVREPANPALYDPEFGLPQYDIPWREVDR